MKVTVIKPGKLVRNPDGLILDARSTVTLIQADDKNIIVDTGVYGEAQQITDGLKKVGLTPDDIDIVINTHLHGDHTGNNALFCSSTQLVHSVEIGGRSSSRSTPGRNAVEEGYEVVPGVKLIHTPGHTRGSMSVVAYADEVYVIAGDALPTLDNYHKWVPPGINFNPAIALESMQRIVNIADIVIPGHDQPLRVKGEDRAKTP